MSATPFETELRERLRAIEHEGLLRGLRRVDSPQGPRIRVDGRNLINFSSNDYLGLAGDPALREAAARAAMDFGAGAGASRLICGSLAPHHQLEEALAGFKHTGAALTFSSGHAAAMGTLPALVGPGDVVILDKLAHACLVDAARLSRAKLRVFAHNDLDDLERILQWAAERPTEKRRPVRVLIVTESVFSMDGDRAPLKTLATLKERFGAWLLVDEAHATGVFGEHRRGLAEATDVADQIEIQMGTLGKALGASGGYICGSRTLIDYLINRARSFIFSTAPVPAAAAAARVAVEIISSERGKELCDTLWSRARQLAAILPHHATDSLSPILPWIIGGEAEAVRTADALREMGFFVPAIRYPTVGRGVARLRFTASAAHSNSDLTALAAAIRQLSCHPQ